MRTCFTAPGSTSALSVFSSIAVPVELWLLLWNWDVQFLAVTPNKKLYQVGNTPMLVEGRFPRSLFDSWVDAEIEGCGFLRSQGVHLRS